MSGYPYGNPQYPPTGGFPPQHPPQQNQIYPQMYPQAFGAPAQPAYPGFQYPSAPVQPPAAMSYAYPAAAPMPTITPTQTYPGFPTQPTSPVEWIPSSDMAAEAHAHRAVVAGFEGHDGSPLWVIRAYHEGDLIPGKLAIKHKSAYVPWGGKEVRVHQFEVCVAVPERIKWVQAQAGTIPPNAIEGGRTSTSETLYIGRANHQRSLTPGKIHPSHKVLYMSFGGEEIPHKVYEVLCAA